MVISSQRWVIRRIGFYQQPSPVVSELEKLMDDLLEFAFYEIFQPKTKEYGSIENVHQCVGVEHPVDCSGLNKIAFLRHQEQSSYIQCHSRVISYSFICKNMQLRVLRLN